MTMALAMTAEAVPQRVLAFGRVSGNDLEAGRNEQHADRVRRLHEQASRLGAYCVAMGWPKPIPYSEIESGGEKYNQSSEGMTLEEFLTRPRGQHRKEQRRLLADLRAGDLILVVKDDRWSRDQRFDADVEDYIRSKGARWHSMQEPWLWDSPRMVKGTVRLQKEQYRDIVRENMVGARKRQRDAGEYTEGLPPFGYRRAERVGAKLKDRFLHVHEGNAPIVREVYKRCLKGESVDRILEWLRHEHDDVPGRAGKARTWDKKVINKMLRSRVYLGEIVNSKGEWIKAHEPITDAVTWARAQKALDSRRLGGEGRKAGEDRKARNADWLLRGLAVCASCGRRMGPSYGAGSDYYACNGRLTGAGCDLPYCKVPVTDAHISALTLAYLQAQRRHLVEYRVARPKGQPDFAADRKKLEARRARVLDMFESGDVDAVERKRRLEKITAELSDLDAREADAKDVLAAQDPKRRADLLTELGAVERAWPRLTPVKKRGVIMRLAADIRLDGANGEAPVRVTWHSPEQLMMSRAAPRRAS